ncbi:MAG: phosphoribosylformylglycinamidine cyclo-ligase [Candidatus Omnitrophota bacterium]
MKNLTYKQSGVDIEKSERFKKVVRGLVRKSFRPEVLKDIGGFGSFFRLAKEKYRAPVLVSSADGVGTKLKIAILVGKHDTIGIDCVAMNVNDILCTGAEPLFFLDYIAYSQLPPAVLKDIVKGVNDGCLESGCSLIGGETAQMPGMYKPGEYDVAGFCVGVVERDKIIDGSKIRHGDALIGLASSGLHSNGYSLVRKVLSQAELKRFSGELLTPTRIYVKPVLALSRASSIGHRGSIHGISHITGGAFYDKLSRILSENVKARIYRRSWPVPKIFNLLQQKGGIEDKEMFHTFNMGVGMVLVVKPNSAKAILSKLAQMKVKARLIGEIVKGRKEVEIV